MAGGAPVRLSIRSWITGVSLLALLPMLCFSALVVYGEITERQDQAQAGLQQQAQVAAVAIGHEVSSVLAELNAVAQMHNLGAGDAAADLASMQALAQRIVASDPRLAAINVGPAVPGADGMLSGVSPLQAVVAGERHAVVVTAPLASGHGGPLMLRATVRTSTFQRRLNEQAWPAECTAAVIDQRQLIVARSRDAERYVGTPATQSLIDGVRSGRTTFQARTKDGINSVASIARVPGVPWLVAAGCPLSALNAEVRRSMLSILIGGVLCAALGTGGALFLARYLGRQLRQVVDGHAAGRDAPASGATIHEVVELAQALTAARGAQAQAAQALHDAREGALAQLKERSAMLDVLAHEVRQPLNNASAALQAASSVLTAGAQPELTAPLQRAGKVLREVQASIDNTLAAAMLLVSGDSLRRQDTDIDALLGVAIADMPQSAAQRVRVERATPTRTATMDAGLMRLALRNLLSNALRCSPPDSPVVVQVADSDEPLALLIDVIDAGPGIEARLLDQLFERGAGPPAAQTGHAGRQGRQGLGLYIVRRVMELHGGSVRLVRNTPQGATLRLVIDQGSDD